MSNNRNKTPAQIQREKLLEIFDKLKEKDKLTKSVETKPQTIDEVTKKWDMNDKIIKLFSNNIEKDTQLKGKYAVILIIILIFQLVALNVIFLLKGFNIIKYSDSTLNIFITGGIAEIFFLVRTIVKYLFRDNITDSLNIILERNNRLERKRYKRKNNTFMRK